jgi:hypothetical protein
MKKIILSIFLIFMLFPIQSSFAQKTDTLPTLSVVLTSNAPFVYHDEQGYTVVVGEVKNTNKLTSVTDVRIRVIFYDDTNPEPLEIVEGKSALQVIPPLGTSPYIIKSKTPNSEITHASVSLGLFNSSTSKSKQLSVEINNIALDDTLHFSGVLKNGAAPSNNATVYFVFYDNFKPPRIIDVIIIPFGSVKSNETINFNFNEKIQSRSVGFTVSAESNVFYSEPKNVIIPESDITTKLVTISKVSILDNEGKNLSEIKVGSTVVIQSDAWIQFSADQKTNETPYTYYVQIKQSGTPYVEFIGNYDGRYIETGQQFQAVDWIPESSGLFFIETFVWDRNNVPIANPGPIVLIIVN